MTKWRIVRGYDPIDDKEWFEIQRKFLWWWTGFGGCYRSYGTAVTVLERIQKHGRWITWHPVGKTHD